MSISIPKVDENRPYREQGPAWLDWGDDHKPLIVCKCGLNRNIRNHTVSASGEVRASFLCEPGCGFHEFLDLEGYTGREWKAGEE